MSESVDERGAPSIGPGDELGAPSGEPCDEPGTPMSGAGDELGAPSPFPHPPWTVGVVLVLGVVSLLFGILVRPIFLLVGSPFILVLLLWIYVRLFARADGADE